MIGLTANRAITYLQIYEPTSEMHRVNVMSIATKGIK